MITKAYALLASLCRQRSAFRVLPNQIHFSTSSSGTVPEQDVDEREESNDMPNFDMENPYKKEQRQCILCKYGIELDYKNTRLISQFLSSFTGRIYDKHITGLCDRQQEQLKYELQKAQRCGMIPNQHKDTRYLKDPALFDPFKPQRPHPY